MDDDEQFVIDEFEGQKRLYSFPLYMKSRWFVFTRHNPFPLPNGSYIDEQQWKQLGVVVLSYQVEKVKLQHLQGYVEVDDYYTIPEIRELLKFNGQEYIQSKYGFFDVPRNRIKAYRYTRKVRSRIAGPFGFGEEPLVA